MAIKIENYKLSVGVTLKEAYIVVSSINYTPHRREFSFLASVATEADLDSPTNVIIERDAIGVDVRNFEYTNQNLVEVAEQMIETKINNVKDKTPEECAEHNNEVVEALGEDITWLDIWDYSYVKYIPGEASEEDDYSQAGKILLGVE